MAYSIGDLQAIRLLIENLIKAMRALEDGDEQLYDWTSSPPFTTNQHHAPLGYGSDVSIFLNGTLFTEKGVRKCVTGLNGFIVHILYDDGGNMIRNGNDLAEKTTYGHVEVRVGESTDHA